MSRKGPEPEQGEGLTREPHGPAEDIEAPAPPASAGAQGTQPPEQQDPDPEPRPQVGRTRKVRGGDEAIWTPARVTRSATKGGQAKQPSSEKKRKRHQVRPQPPQMYGSGGGGGGGGHSEGTSESENDRSAEETVPPFSMEVSDTARRRIFAQITPPNAQTEERLKDAFKDVRLDTALAKTRKYTEALNSALNECGVTEPFELLYTLSLQGHYKIYRLKQGTFLGETRTGTGLQRRLLVSQPERTNPIPFQLDPEDQFTNEANAQLWRDSLEQAEINAQDPIVFPHGSRKFPTFAITHKRKIEVAIRLVEYLVRQTKLADLPEAERVNQMIVTYRRDPYTQELIPTSSRMTVYDVLAQNGSQYQTVLKAFSQLFQEPTSREVHEAISEAYNAPKGPDCSDLLGALNSTVQKWEKARELVSMRNQG